MTTADLLASQTHPAKLRTVEILKRVFPNVGEMPAWQIACLMGAVEDVLAEKPAPWLSRAERLKIEDAAKEIA